MQHNQQPRPQQGFEYQGQFDRIDPNIDYNLRGGRMMVNPMANNFNNQNNMPMQRNPGFNYNYDPRSGDPNMLPYNGYQHATNGFYNSSYQKENNFGNLAGMNPRGNYMNKNINK